MSKKKIPQEQDKKEAQVKKVIIKKYSNRRLYNMQESIYITLSDVRDMVANNIEFIVIDAKNDNDLTRSVLLQIIMDAEQSSNPILSNQVLSQFIRSYSNAMQNITSGYLDQQMHSLNTMQQKWLEDVKNTHGDKFNNDIWNSWLENNQNNLMQNFVDVSNNWQENMLQMWGQIQEQNRQLQELSINNINKINSLKNNPLVSFLNMMGIKPE
jgi:polyhydroxyalkanoate synthesis repressor PhaR